MAGPKHRATRESLLSAARHVLDESPNASIDEIAAAAQISKATFYRQFRSRGDLLAALDMEPERDARERVLAAAADLVGRDGLAAMSMDELAANAGVSRASVYRLFPGKPALFEAVIVAYSPLRMIVEQLTRLEDEPVDVVLPSLYRMAAHAAAPRMGLMRAIFFGVTSGSPEALEGAGRPVHDVLMALGGYLERQMDAGHFRRMHPTLAAQILIGPMLFHLFTRPFVGSLGGLEMTLDEAADEIAATMLRCFELGPPGASASTSASSTREASADRRSSSDPARHGPARARRPGDPQ